MADVNANIGVSIDTSAALAQLKALQRQISQFHSSIARSSESAALSQRSLQKNLLSSINSIGAFSAELRTVKTSAETFTNSLEKNKFSMREYFRYAGASTKTFGRLFKSEFDTIGKVSEERVKTLQTQYIKMGRNASGAMEAIAIRPTSLNMQDLGTKISIAAQKQALFNQLMKQGSTNLLNFGKNTQWAGRQLMVGFTLPLMAVGAAATKTFMEMEAQAIKFKKVYGDLFTPKEETQEALDNITQLGKAFTQYGVAVSTTVGLAAEAAAAGFSGLDLQRQTTEATRLSILGQIDSQQALETTISLQNAFGMSSDKLAQSIDFLNAVENQTVVSLDDITIAIPKVAPVIQQLGGDVKDLTFFIAAMKEGGINASEGANALKSGLAALINPTGRASEMLQSFGINAREIVVKNKGDLKATVIEFAEALNELDPLNRAQAIEQMFGKFQFARLSTLFANVTKEGNQAARVLSLANSSVEELSSLSEQELGMTADSAMNKFKKTVEDLKLALVPVGQAFLEAATPILEFVGGVLEKFGNLSAGTKRLITVLTVGIGAVGPIFLMTFGLLANLLANAVKGAMILRQGYLRLSGQSEILGQQTQYLNSEQLEAAAAAHSLDQSHARLTQQFTAETAELQKLIAAYQSATRAGQSFMFNNPGMMMPGRSPKKLASGIVSVPGPKGAGDIVPAMLSPGEAVIPAEFAKKYAPLIQGMVAGNIPGYKDGVSSLYGGQERNLAPYTMFAPGNKPGGFGMSPEFLETKGFSQSLRNTAVQAGAIEGNMRLTKQKILEMADEVSPYTEQITTELRTAANEMSKTGKSASHISQLFEKRKKEIEKILSKLSATGPTGAGMAKGISSFAYPTDADIISGGNVRVPGVDVDESGNVVRAAPRSVRTGKAKRFQTGIKRVTGMLPLDTSEKLTRAHVVPEERVIAGGIRPLAGGVLGLSPEKQIKARVELEKRNATLSKKLGIQSARSAIEATEKEAQTFSPSRKTIKIGQDIARGLEVGMTDRQDDVARVGTTLANAAVGGVRNVPFRAPGQPGYVASNAPKSAGIPLSQITEKARINRENLLNIQQQKQSQLLTTSSQKLGNLNSKIMGGTFALTSFAGIASMAGGNLGKLSEAIFKISGVAFAFSSILQILPKSLLGFIGKFKFAFGGAALALTAGIAIIKFVNSQREKERKQLEAFGDAIKNSTKQVESLGEYFGVVPTKTGLESTKPQLILDKNTRESLDKFKASDTFKEFASTIEAVSKLSDTDAATALKTRGQELLGKGFSKEQVSLILRGIQEEAGKTSLKIDFRDIDVDALNTELQTELGSKFSALPKFISDNLERQMVLEADGRWYSKLVPGKKIEAELNNTGAMFKTYLNGLSGMFKNGVISGEKFNSTFAKTMDTLITQIPNARQQTLLLNAALNQMDSELAKNAMQINDVKTKILLLQAAAVGATVSMAALGALRIAADNPTSAEDQIRKGAIEADIRRAIADATKLQELANKSLNNSFKDLNNTETKKTKTQLDVLKQAQEYIQLQEQLIDMQNAPKLKAYNDELERQEDLLKNINKQIDSITETAISPIEAKIKSNAYLIDQIAIKEDEINERYNLQIDALNKIRDINDEIAASEKEKLTLADALSRGDISAAAVIAQEARSRQAAFINERMQGALTTSRDSRINLLGRNALEKENKQLQLDIATIQNNQIEPLNLQKDAIQKNINAQNEMKFALEKTIEKRKEEIKYLGLTKSQIDEAVKALDLAQNENINIKSDSFLTNALRGALGDTNALKRALDEVAKSAASAFKTPLAKKITGISTAASFTTPIDPFESGVDPRLGRQSAKEEPWWGYLAKGGMVPKYYVAGGYSKGTDTIPAMLTPGEFVVRKNAVESFGVNNLNKINDGSYGGSSVYNYSLNVNVKSDANPNDIARTVMTQIKQIDNQRIKTQRGA
jgi:TP901 family phage tail tape measure protein